MTTLLIAGAGGFIGGHLAKSLIESQRGVTVRCVDIKPVSEWYQVHPDCEFISEVDLRDPALCRDVMEGVSDVYNLAADMGGMGFIESHKSDCMRNVLINTHLLEEARRSGVQRYFFASSACVYPNYAQQRHRVSPLRESEAYPAAPEDGYGWEKLFSERLCRHYQEDYGLATRVARFHNVYGAHGAWQGGREKAPAAICRKVAEAKIRGTKTIEIWGDGQQGRSFTHVDDCVAGIQSIMGGEFGNPVNLGSDEGITIDGLVDVVEAVAGIKLERIYMQGAPMGVKWRNSDNSLFKQRYGYAPQVTIREGIASTYEWIYNEVLKASSQRNR